jgi:hypothetical protein
MVAVYTDDFKAINRLKRTMRSTIDTSSTATEYADNQVPIDTCESHVRWRDGGSGPSEASRKASTTVSQHVLAPAGAIPNGGMYANTLSKRSESNNVLHEIVGKIQPVSRASFSRNPYCSRIPVGGRISN